MDIEQFYSQDERRRRSEEVELGNDWHDAEGVRYELSWIADTGELYVMREPNMPLVEDPFGDVFPATFSGSMANALPVAELQVAVVGRISEQARVEEVLAGWQDEMIKPGSVSWVADRLKAFGVPRSS